MKKLSILLAANILFILACKDPEVEIIIENPPQKNCSLNVYPNPSAGKFTANTDCKTVFYIYNTFGQKVDSLDFRNKSEIESEINENGIYFISSKEGKVTTRIIISK